MFAVHAALAERADPGVTLSTPVETAVEAHVIHNVRVTFEFLESIPERDVIRKRLTELWDYERYGTPYKRGGRTFFQKNDGLQNQYVIYYQKGLEGEPEVFIDGFESGNTSAGTTVAPQEAIRAGSEKLNRRSSRICR